MSSLFETPFRQLLPSSVRSDPMMIAIANVIDKELALARPLLRGLLIWSRIDELEEPLLSHLAIQLHLDAYEGWQLAETLEQKRALVEEAIPLHRLKGTRYAIERVIQVLGLSGRVVEWWEVPEGQPYPTLDDVPFVRGEYDIEIDADRKLSDETLRMLCLMIESYGRKSQHLRRIRARALPVGSIYVGGAAQTATSTTVYPLPSTSSPMATIYVGAAIQSLTNITVAPNEVKP